MSTLLNRIIFVLITTLLIILMFFTYSRGILINDEGWVVNPAARILQGDIPYKDFHYIYTPGAAYVTALSLFLFGNSIYSSRILVFLISLLSMLTIIFISKQLKLKTMSILIAISIFVIFAPLHVNFSWPVMYAIFSSLLTVLFLLKGVDKNIFRFFFLSGITIALTIFFKQNFGLATLISSGITICFLINTDRVKKMFYMLLGLFAFLGIWGLYMFFTNSLIPFLQDFYLFMIDQTLLKHLQATPFIYPATLLEQIIKTLFYLSPLLISVFSIFVIRKEKKYFLSVPIFVLIFYLLGIRPTTDYTHLVPLVSLTGLPIGMIITFSKKRGVRASALILAVFLVLLGFYTLIYRGYYKWNPPILENTYSVNNPRVNVLVSGSVYSTISKLSPYINKYTKMGDYIFVYRYSPLFYFIFDRKNPTKFEFAPINVLTTPDQKEIILNLRNTDTKLIITDFDIYQENSMLTRYIIKNFKNEVKNEGYILWLKK